jgi:threonyl-tRNA synthetase
MPERLGAEYVAEDNTRQIPVMLHRAILGSLERFIGILIENHAGALPLWLSPVQVVVLNISEGQSDYAREVTNKLKNNDIRAQSDLRNEKITYKIREHSLQKLPYQIIVGDKEVAAEMVAVRTRSGLDLGQMSLQALIERLKVEISTRADTV